MVSTPRLDELAPRLEPEAWKTWQELPSNVGLLLTKRELGAMMEALLYLSQAVREDRTSTTDSTSRRMSEAELSSDPIAKFIREALHLVERDVVIDGGTF